MAMKSGYSLLAPLLMELGSSPLGIQCRCSNSLVLLGLFCSNAAFATSVLSKSLSIPESFVLFALLSGLVKAFYRGWRFTCEPCCRKLTLQALLKERRKTSDNNPIIKSKASMMAALNDTQTTHNSLSSKAHDETLLNNLLKERMMMMTTQEELNNNNSWMKTNYLPNKTKIRAANAFATVPIMGGCDNEGAAKSDQEWSAPEKSTVTMTKSGTDEVVPKVKIKKRRFSISNASCLTDVRVPRQAINKSQHSGRNYWHERNCSANHYHVRSEGSKSQGDLDATGDTINNFRKSIVNSTCDHCESKVESQRVETNDAGVLVTEEYAAPFTISGRRNFDEDTADESCVDAEARARLAFQNKKRLLKSLNNGSSIRNKSVPLEKRGEDQRGLETNNNYHLETYQVAEKHDTHDPPMKCGRNSSGSLLAEELQGRSINRIKTTPVFDESFIDAATRRRRICGREDEFPHPQVFVNQSIPPGYSLYDDSYQVSAADYKMNNKFRFLRLAIWKRFYFVCFALVTLAVCDSFYRVVIRGGSAGPHTLRMENPFWFFSILCLAMAPHVNNWKRIYTSFFVLAHSLFYALLVAMTDSQWHARTQSGSTFLQTLLKEKLWSANNNLSRIILSIFSIPTENGHIVVGRSSVDSKAMLTMWLNRDLPIIVCMLALPFAISLLTRDTNEQKSHTNKQLGGGRNGVKSFESPYEARLEEMNNRLTNMMAMPTPRRKVCNPSRSKEKFKVNLNYETSVPDEQ